MSTEKFDVVVIGAGLGGLSTAGYLAKAGKKVLVLENNPIPGGYAQEFRRGKYRFEAALHAMDGVAPGGWAYRQLKDLDVLERVKFHRLDPFYTARYPEHEIVAHADLIEYETELFRHFPHEKEGIRAMFSEMLEIFWQVRRFAADGENETRPPVEEMPTHFGKMLEAMSMSLEDFIARFIRDEKLIGVFTTLWPYYGLPPKQLNAATFIFPVISFHLFGGFYPEGGSMAISRALEKTIVEYGGEIRYRQKVNKILIENGLAVGVETEKALRVDADVVVSNANTPDTLLKFVGRENLPKGYQAKIESEANSIASLCVFLGLDRDLVAEGFHHHELFLYDDYDPEANYQNMLAGNFGKGMGVSCYNVHDSSCSPEGTTILALISMADWDTDNQWGTGGNLENYSKNPQYLELKEAAGDALIARAEELIPRLRDSIVHKEIATPLTNWRYSQNPGGGIYGSAQSVDNMYFNRLNAKTPIPNLFLAGAWAFGGGMSAATLSGRETSRLVKGYLDGDELEFLMNVELPEDSEQKPVESGSSRELSASTKGQLPATTLKAIGSGREIALDKIGKPAMLLFHTQETAEQAAKVNAAVRDVARFAKAENLFIANVVDLHSVPKLFRNFAERAMKSSYEEAAANLPAGYASEDYVIILPDWDGEVTKAAGLKDVNQMAGVVMLDADGNLIGVYQGEAAVESALDLVKSAF
ncbi:MAG: NAD(P)/FAD-dependent oxidoreductase [Anaerolineae bacterium]|nr:NAD(P)/FAD-dependent oxidoreductase [Anaerolineae bacterium]